uniref:bifunctional phosphopantothenoylcysteine decarboxylase/phosphopantothenate--cysteine ligase CoaBC n=1 Tax=Ningiella ruwaisensis TaxID=2364274 RepID=UPI00109EF8A6|nr:bifunctional phosphopantothenoylcysteine decarboxylase/phosphopantothenate--cysteine ligase CoaBC [Ningiella ruwaisensis]
MQLEQKNVLVGVSGGIAAYKTPDLVRKLKAQGANVRVVLTESATHFVSSLSLQAVSGEKVSTHLLDEDAEAGMGHIELARWADIFLIAPATANCIAKLATGLADDLLSTLALATPAPILIAPAMNQQMWAAKATQQNMQTLLDRGVAQLGPASGEQACGDLGYGRMLEPVEIVEALASFVAINLADDNHLSDEMQPKPLAGKQVMITAGPTREAIDPVRYISNHSSGKMGFALARAAQNLGAKVTLISGPVSLSTPDGITRVDVTSAQEMLDAVEKDIDSQDVFVACAAVADYRIAHENTQKLKKKAEDLVLTFTKNPDILKRVAQRKNAPFTLGFAAETQDVEAYARTKLEDKKLNMIAANDVSQADIGFNSDQNALLVITKDNTRKLAKASKDSLARDLLKIVSDELFKSHKK